MTRYFRQDYQDLFNRLNIYGKCPVTRLVLYYWNSLLILLSGLSFMRKKIEHTELNINSDCDTDTDPD